MIQFQHGILHILDFRSGVGVYSEEELAPEIHDFLEKHIEKAMNDAAAHESRLAADNLFWQRVAEFQAEKLSFVQLSQDIAQQIYQQLQLAEEEQGVDVVVCQFHTEQSSYLGILEYTHQIGYTHQVGQQGEKTKTDIIRHFAILPSPTQKISSYAFVDLSSREVIFADRRKMINGEAVHILPDQILYCAMPISQKDTIKKVNSIVNQVAEEYGQNVAQAVSKAKTYLLENARTSDELIPEQLGRQVFAQSPGMQKDFMEKVQKAKLPPSAPVERDFVVKTVSAHKIKTDNGIEISVPSDFLNNPDVIEFINNPDGTISISIKNIGKILNKG